MKPFKRARRVRRSLTVEQLETRLALAIDLVPLVDINSNPSATETFEFEEVGPVTFFVGTTNTSRGLWKTDGTEAGTVLVREFESVSYNERPRQLTNVGGTLFFTARDSRGVELWKSDGTRSGTVLVRDINVGLDGSYPLELVNVAGTLFFTAELPTRGAELWKSDGTSAGTVLVRDLVGGPGSSSPRHLTAVNSTLYFVASNSLGVELFSSDGTAAGTRLVRDIVPGSESSSPANLVNVNGTLLFSATTPSTGRELWKSAGTAGTTVLVKDSVPGPIGMTIGETFALGNTLYFAANTPGVGNELWKSNGTATSTVLVTDINPGPNSSGPQGFTNINNVVYFSARGAIEGRELWRTNGTAAGTVLVKDINVGAASSYPSNMRTIGSVLYFSARTAENGAELWRSNGSNANTLLVKDIVPGPDSSYPGIATEITLKIAAVGGQALFMARSNAVDNPERLFVSSGSSSSTNPLAAFGSATGDAIDSEDFANVNGILYFLAGSGGTGTTDLWKTDGSAAGTTLVRSFDSFYGVRYLTNVNGTLFFTSGDSSTGRELWKSDGTFEGTVMVTDILPGPSSSYPRSLLPFGSTLYFTANGGSGVELWKSNGTASGTVQVRDIQPGSQGSYPYGLVAVGNRVYFSATSAAGAELWSTNGSAAGTVMVKDINPGIVSSAPTNLTRVGSQLYFVADDGVNGSELWVSSGTEASTFMVKDILTGSYSSYPQDLTAVGNTLYFTANDGIVGRELWKSNGTEASTVLVQDIVPSEASSYPVYLTNVSGRLYFTASNSVGRELWRSDGTAAGTVLVRDILPGAGSSYPSNLTNIGGRLYFSATNGISGRELWSSTGAFGSTVLEADINSGPSDSNPGPIVSLNGLIMTVATGSTVGREWFSEQILIALRSRIDNPSNTGSESPAEGEGANQAPVITDGAVATLPTITEDQNLPAPDWRGVFMVSTLLRAAGYADADNADPLFGSGIAITGLVGRGYLAYATDASGGWIRVPAVSPNNALLLASNFYSNTGWLYPQWLVYVPDGNNGEEVTINFRAWDLTSGLPSNKTPLTLTATPRFGDASINGGNTAYSAGLGLGRLNVTSVNDAPVINNSAVVRFIATNENRPSAAKTVDSILIERGWSDVDIGASRGMAVLATSGLGNWQYSTDGVTWVDVGVVSSSSALLLSGTTRLRYMPDLKNGETARLVFKSWDMTNRPASTNTFRSLGRATPSGGNSAFSSVNAQAITQVFSLNDAPIIVPRYFALPGTDEDTISPPASVESMLTAFSWSDVDNGALKGIAVIGATGVGIWQYSTDGETWTNFGQVSRDSALLLSASTQVRFAPDPRNAVSGSLQILAWDQTTGVASRNSLPSFANAWLTGSTTAFSTASAFASMSVRWLNDAPTIAANVVVPMTPTNEDSVSAAILVQDVLTASSYDDPDVNSVPGLAIIGLSGNGIWQYSTNGVDWTGFTQVAETAALVLSSTTRLRYMPDGRNGEIATLQYRAWNVSLASANGQPRFANATIVGGESDFSVNVGTIALQVSSLNDAPTITDGLDITIPVRGPDSVTAPILVSSLLVASGWSDVDNLAQNGMAVVGLAPGGWWQYSVDGVNWQLLPAVSQTESLLLSPTTQLRCWLNLLGGGNPALRFKAWDQTVGEPSAGNQFSRADASQGGGLSAYSLGIATATVRLVVD